MPYDPWAHAKALDVVVIEHPLRTAKGMWLPTERVILVRPGMRHFMERAVLAHELVHAEYDDPPGVNPLFEARANRVAAERLIDPAEWSALTRMYGDYDRICIDLGITREMFIEYAGATETDMRREA